VSGPRSFLDGRVVLHHGDSREVLRGLADNSVDSVVTDPPYALVSIGKRFGADGAAPAKAGKTGAYQRASAGFMGQKWDTGETAFDPDFWREVRRVLKPGGHVVAFSGTRTYHRLACAIEDAGFEIRDCIAWLYGTGFPKSHDVSKAIDKAAGAEREVISSRRAHDIRGGNLMEASQGLQVGSYSIDITAPPTDDAKLWQGWGTALKPAIEPIVLARKPLSEGTVAANVLRWGTGAINLDGCRVKASGRPMIESRSEASQGVFGDGLNGSRAAGTPDQGRWPANVVHDGSAEVLAAFPDAAGQLRPVTGAERAKRTVNVLGDFSGSRHGAEPRGDAGSAARFFYSAKADADDRIGSKHPTVKPVDLMQWLCRLVTPPGGVVLEPFAGSGSTGEAAWREGFRAVLVEREAQYCEDIARRMALCLSGMAERRRESVKARGLTADAGPLFGGHGEAQGGGDGSTASSRTNTGGGGPNDRPGRTQAMSEP